MKFACDGCGALKLTKSLQNAISVIVINWQEFDKEVERAEVQSGTEITVLFARKDKVKIIRRGG